jgi:hypothetical protein
MIKFDNKLDEEIARALLAGESLTACACMGCRDLAADGSCPCGKGCKCLCTLPHRREQSREFNERISRVRLALRRDRIASRTGEGIIGTRDDGEPADESGHFEVCPVCGQAFDRRVLELAIYHNQPVHEPMKRES